MRLLRPWLLVVPILVLSAVESRSHHSFAPVYDGSREITVVGVATDFRFVNPHAMMCMDVTDETGNVVQWEVELGGQLQLTEAGWTADSIKRRERVTVIGNPTHTGSPRLAFRRLVRLDGTELIALGEQRRRAVEEERRQRALKRSQ